MHLEEDRGAHPRAQHPRGVGGGDECDPRDLELQRGTVERFGSPQLRRDAQLVHRDRERVTKPATRDPAPARREEAARCGLESSRGELELLVHVEREGGGTAGGEGGAGAGPDGAAGGRRGCGEDKRTRPDQWRRYLGEGRVGAQAEPDGRQGRTAGFGHLEGLMDGLATRDQLLVVRVDCHAERPSAAHQGRCRRVVDGGSGGSGGCGGGVDTDCTVGKRAAAPAVRAEGEERDVDRGALWVLWRRGELLEQRLPQRAVALYRHDASAVQPCFERVLGRRGHEARRDGRAEEPRRRAKAELAHEPAAWREGRAP